METEKRPGAVRMGALIAALLLLLCAGVSARAEQGADGDDDVALMLAESAAETLGLKDAEGKALQPRQAFETQGRGNPDADGAEPDYRGVVGYASLQAGWDVSRFNTFTTTPWILPVYERDGDRWTEAAGEMIRHKTPVLIVDQALQEQEDQIFRGYLDVVRLDSMQRVWIDVTQFCTVPYWTLELAEAVKYGYCIGIYRDTSRYEPMDRDGRRHSEPDGVRVLLCCGNPPKYESKDREHNPILGILFRNGEGGGACRRDFLFFNPQDLTLIY